MARQVTHIYRSLGPWDGPMTPESSRRPRRTFSASWSDTLDLLAREVRFLGGDDFVLEVDFAERDIRLDGRLRKDARAPRFPGVRVGFDSKYGQLVYATDVCVDWKHNVRAVALGLEALRAATRHGITRRGEQYQGSLAIEAAKPMTRQEAARLLGEHARRSTPPDPLDQLGLEIAYRAAAKFTHPDHGGSTAAFQQVQEARRVLGI